MPPPETAELALSVLLATCSDPFATEMPPPLTSAEFPVIVLFTTVIPLLLPPMPPPETAELPLIVLLTMLTCVYAVCCPQPCGQLSGGNSPVFVRFDTW